MNSKSDADQKVLYYNSTQLIGNNIEFKLTNYNKTKYHDHKTSYDIIMNNTTVGNVSYYNDYRYHIRWYEKKLRFIFKDSSVKVGYQLEIHYPLNIHGYSKPLSAIEFYLNGLIENRNRYFTNQY